MRLDRELELGGSACGLNDVAHHCVANRVARRVGLCGRVALEQGAVGRRRYRQVDMHATAGGAVVMPAAHGLENRVSIERSVRKLGKAAIGAESG
ncbi:MAG: hypothetical protein R3D67_15170 [Hyphomicrobiaceae bacterium]